MSDQVQPEDLITFYRSIRSGIMTSSLTVGAFLFTMKSFIVLNMKKEVYDQPAYHDIVRFRRSKGKNERLYHGLGQLKVLLYWSILAALLNALAQVTLGYIAKPWAVLVALGFTLLSWSLVGYSLFHVSSNLTTMLRFGEDNFDKGIEPPSKK